MTGPAYPIARAAALAVQPRFAGVLAEAGDNGGAPVAPLPEVDVMEQVINAAFWASLLREEGYAPRISLALLPPEDGQSGLMLERPLPLEPRTLVPLAPAVEGPGIHLGVWRDGSELCVWGATRAIPAFCFVLEVVTPGLLVIKLRRQDESAKFVNIAVLEGDRMKLVDSHAASLPGLGFNFFGDPPNPHHPLLEMALAMRAHRRGGALLIVPAGSTDWRVSIVQPATYQVSPPFSLVAELIRVPVERREPHVWPDAFRRAVAVIGGATSIDGATIITNRYELIAIGAKIRRRRGSAPVERLVLMEPIEGQRPRTVAAPEIGGTRHLSAAQFVHDQRDALALVASQDGRFTVFAWSPADRLVRADRVEALLM